MRRSVSQARISVSRQHQAWAEVQADSILEHSEEV
jgi:hypothetical protein